MQHSDTLAVNDPDLARAVAFIRSHAADFFDELDKHGNREYRLANDIRNGDNFTNDAASAISHAKRSRRARPGSNTNSHPTTTDERRIALWRPQVRSHGDKCSRPR